MHLHNADQTFEATVTKEKLFYPLSKDFITKQEVDFLKIAHHSYSQTSWSGLTILGPTNPAKPTVYSDKVNDKLPLFDHFFLIPLFLGRCNA